MTYISDKLTVLLFLPLLVVPLAGAASAGKRASDASEACESDGGLSCGEESIGDMKLLLLQTSSKLHGKSGTPTAPSSKLLGKMGTATAPSSVGGEIMSVLHKASSGHALKATAPPNKSSAKGGAANSTGTNSSLKQGETVPLKASDYSVSVLVFLTMAVLGILAQWMVTTEEMMAQSIGPLIAEFVGTFVLVFTVMCCSISGSDWNAVAIAAVLMAMIYATAPLSGGHLNPAVTIALRLAGKVESLSLVVQYCATQLLAGVLASFTFSVFFTSTQHSSSAFLNDNAWWDAWLMETLYTAMLCFVVLNVAASKRNNPLDDGNQFFALAIGLVIIAGGYPSGPISGAHFNPAVSLGFEMITQDSIGYGFLWAIFQCIGAAIAAILFRIIRPEEYDLDALLRMPSFLCCCLAEMLGTSILVFTVGMNLGVGTQHCALSAAAALASMIYALGDISGAHFNPAVTVAIVFAGRDKCHIARGFAYIMFQLLGGVFGGIMCAFQDFKAPPPASPAPPQYTVGNGVIVETIFTTLLAYAVLAIATTLQPSGRRSQKNFYFGLCIGACVMVGGTCAGSISGAALNPAVTFGNFCTAVLHDLRATVTSASDLNTSVQKAITLSVTLSTLLFPLAQISGGIVAALVFRLTHRQEFVIGHSATMLEKMFAEAWGTFYLVITVGFCSLANTDSSSWANPLAIALVLMIMIYALGEISGGHFNPAVSFAIKKAGATVELFSYCTAQILGGLLAGLLVTVFFDKAVVIEPQAPFNWVHSVVAESIYTFMLCFVVLNVAVCQRNNPSHDKNQFFGLAIGFVIIAGGYAAGSISGACFNPAVSLGFAGAGTLFFWKWSLYWACAWVSFQVVAALGAAQLYLWVRHNISVDHHIEQLLETTPTFAAAYSCEFVGTFLLVMTVGLNTITSSTATAFSAAGSLLSMVYAVGDVSGAYFNPAVTLAAVLSGRGKLSPRCGVAYMGSQLLAAILAGHLYAGFHMVGVTKDISYPLEPRKGFSFVSAGFAELFFTAVLAYVVLSTATVIPPISQTSMRNSFFGLAIAACVVAGGVAVGGVSGGELNPAVSLGISSANLAHNGLGPASPAINFAPFSLWQFSGAIFAAIIFRLTHGSEFMLERSKLGSSTLVRTVATSDPKEYPSSDHRILSPPQSLLKTLGMSH